MASQNIGYLLLTHGYKAKAMWISFKLHRILHPCLTNLVSTRSRRPLSRILVWTSVSILY